MKAHVELCKNNQILNYIGFLLEMSEKKKMQILK